MDERDPYRELAERLLVPAYTFDGRPVAAELVPGRVPEGLPFELPVPSGAFVLGGVARRSDAGPASADVVLNAAGAAGDVEAF